MLLRKLYSSVTSFGSFSFIPSCGAEKGQCPLSDKTAMWLNGELEGERRRQKWALLERRRLGSGWRTIYTERSSVKENGTEREKGFR